MKSVVAGVLLAFSAQVHGALSLTKTAMPASITAGDDAVFVYSIQNGGTTAVGVSLADTLPAGVIWSDNSGSCSVNPQTRLLTCSFGNMSPSARVAFRVSGTTDFSDCGDLSSTATVMSSVGGDKASATVTVLCPSLVASDGVESRKPGQALAFTMGLRSLGPGIARSVVYTIRIPQPGFFWSLEPPDPLCEVTGDTTTCTLGDLPPGTGHSFRLASSTPVEELCGCFDNQHFITVANGPDPFFAFSVFVFQPTFTKAGDADGTCSVNVTDILYLINFLFAGGPAPTPKECG